MVCVCSGDRVGADVGEKECPWVRLVSVLVLSSRGAIRRVFVVWARIVRAVVSSGVLFILARSITYAQNCVIKTDSDRMQLVAKNVHFQFH